MTNLFINDCYFNTLDQLKEYLASATIESGSMQATQIYDAVYGQDLRQWVVERHPDQTELIAALERLDSGPILPVSEVLQRVIALITAQAEVHISKPDFAQHAKLIGEAEISEDSTNQKISTIKLRFQVFQPINESYDLALCDADGVARSAVKQLSLDVDRGTSEVNVMFTDLPAEHDLWLQIGGQKATQVYQFKRYRVGDYYDDGKKRGVVFEVDESGRHGKIVSLQQSKRELQWAAKGVARKRIGARNRVDGMANMKVVQQQANWHKNYPAFAWCASLGEGWYLPAIEELESFTLNDEIRNAVNKTLKANKGVSVADSWYWSSTESEGQGYEFCAWNVDMYPGDTDYNTKYLYGYVRAVSAF